MLRKSIVRQWGFAGPLLARALGVSACATAQPPVASLSQAEMAVHQADASHAAVYAPLEVAAARDRLDEARLAFDVQQYEQAHRLAEQALADARLAEARAEVESSRQTARDLRLRLEILRAEATLY